MSVHAAPMSLPHPRRRRGCLGALGCVVAGVVACLIVAIVLSLPQGGRVRQWHPYGRTGPVVTVYHQYTWGHALSFEPLVSVGYDRYVLLAGEEPSGSYGEEVPVPGYFAPGSADLSRLRVTGDKTGITVTYPSGDRAFVPKTNLKGR